MERRDVERLIDADTARRQRRDVRERVAPEDAEDRVEAHGDAVGGEQDGDHGDLAAPREQLRKHDASSVGSLVGEDLAAPPRLVPSPLQPPGRESPADGEHERGADDGERDRPRVARQEPEFPLEGAADGEEQIAEHDDADDGEEELLDRGGGRALRSPSRQG